MSRPRSLIFWLLLAATIAIDVVAFSRIDATSSAAFLNYRVVICDALLASEVSIVIIWAALRTNKILWIPAFTAVLVAAFAAAMFEDPSETFASTCRLFLSLYGFEAALLLAALWLFRGTRFWRGRTGSSIGWQFSLAHILLVMTAVALLTTAMRAGPFADEDKWVSVGFALSVVLLALVSAIVWSFAWHWLLRFAVTLGAALVLGSLLSFFTGYGAAGFYTFASHYLVQALVLSSWLGWGPILPPAIEGAESDTAAARQLP